MGRKTITFCRNPDFHDLTSPLRQKFHTDSKNSLKISKACHASWLYAQLTGWLATLAAAQPENPIPKIKKFKLILAGC
jgi:hypothetical protein